MMKKTKYISNYKQLWETEVTRVLVATKQIEDLKDEIDFQRAIIRKLVQK